MLSIEQAKANPENRSEFLSELLKKNRGLIRTMLRKRLGPAYFELMGDDIAQQAFLIGANRAIDRAYGVKMEKFNPLTFIVNKGLFEIRNELKQINRDRKKPLSNVYVIPLDDAFESEIPQLDNIDRDIIADIALDEFKQTLTPLERRVCESLMLGYGPPQKNHFPGDRPGRHRWGIKEIAKQLGVSEIGVYHTIASLKTKALKRQLELGV